MRSCVPTCPSEYKGKADVYEASSLLHAIFNLVNAQEMSYSDLDGLSFRGFSSAFKDQDAAFKKEYDVLVDSVHEGQWYAITVVCGTPSQYLDEEAYSGRLSQNKVASNDVRTDRFLFALYKLADRVSDLLM